MIDIAAEVSTALAPVLEELRAVRAELVQVAAVRAELTALGAACAELAALRAVSPIQWISQARAAELLGCSIQTVAAMAKRKDILTRRAGRRVLVDSASLRPASAEQIAELARQARGQS